MPAYIQEVLDLIEWANGPATPNWGAKRAAAGHPEPFNLEYLGIGNEENITPEFEERFKMIYDAVRQGLSRTSRHRYRPAPFRTAPISTTAGGSPTGCNSRWSTSTITDRLIGSFAKLRRYDKLRPRSVGRVSRRIRGPRTRPEIDAPFGLAEAAYMTSLERNGDVVRLSSYSPLLAKPATRNGTPI